MELQSILTQMVGLHSGNSLEGNVSSQKSEGKNGVVFRDYMTSATKQNETNALKNQNVGKDDYASTDVVQEVPDAPMEQNAKTTETSDSVSMINNESKDAELVTENVAGNSENLFVVQNAAHEWEEEVEEVLCEEFDLTLEELEKIMEELGLQFVDLQNLANVQQLVLAVAGTDDKTALLTNESLAMQVVSVEKTIEQITTVLTQEYGTDVEEMTDYLMRDAQPEDTESADTLMNISENVQEPVKSISEDGSDNENVLNENLQQYKQVTEVEHEAEKEPVLETTEVYTADTGKIQMSTDKKIVSADLDTEEAKAEPHIEISVEKQTEKTDENLQEGKKEFSGSDKKRDSQNVFEHFVESLSANRTTSVEQTNVKLDAITQMREIVTQLVEQIKIQVNADTTSMEIQLNPESLGKVNLTVVAKEGHITAQFVTENEIARRALEGQVQQIRETLGEQGLKVDEVEVTVSNFDFSHSNQTNAEEQRQQHNQEQRRVYRNLNLNDTIDLNELSEEEQLTARIMIDNGNQVDYTA